MLRLVVHLLGFQTIPVEGRPSTGRTRAGGGGASLPARPSQALGELPRLLPSSDPVGVSFLWLL